MGRFRPKTGIWKAAGVLGGALVAVTIAAVVVIAVGPSPNAVNPVLGDVEAEENPLGAITIALPDGDIQASSPSGPQQQEALATALADGGIATQLEGVRYRAVMYRLQEQDDGKADPRPCQGPDCVIVSFYIYTVNRVLDVWVDTTARRVRGMEISEGQPPPSPEEQATAHAIAEADPELVSKVAGAPHAHNVLAYPMWPEAPPCTRDRCVGVMFYLDGIEATGIGRQANVIVDLTTNRVAFRIFHTCTPRCTLGW